MENTKNNPNEYVCKLRESLVAAIKTDLNAENNGKLGGMLIKAYNAWQKAEHDDVDHIFDIFAQEDLKTAVDGGLTAYQIYNLLGDTTHAFGLFFYGQNYPNPKPIENLKELLLADIYDIVDFVLHYPYVDGCTDLYEYYITSNYMA